MPSFSIPSKEVSPLTSEMVKARAPNEAATSNDIFPLDGFGNTLIGDRPLGIFNPASRDSQSSIVVCTLIKRSSKYESLSVPAFRVPVSLSLIHI